MYCNPMGYPRPAPHCNPMGTPGLPLIATLWVPQAYPSLLSAKTAPTPLEIRPKKVMFSDVGCSHAERRSPRPCCLPMKCRPPSLATDWSQGQRLPLWRVGQIVDENIVHRKELLPRLSEKDNTGRRKIVVASEGQSDTRSS